MWQFDSWGVEALAHVDASFSSFICHLHILQEATGHCLQSIPRPALTRHKSCTLTLPYIQCILLSTVVYCNSLVNSDLNDLGWQIILMYYIYNTVMMQDIHQNIYCTLTWNQLMVQQLMRAGKRLKRFLKASPMGLMANTTCSCVRQRSINMLKRDRGLPSVCFSRSRCRSRTRIRSQISCFSSTANRLGT